MDEIAQAKIRLYGLLLAKPSANWTDNETDLAFYLAKDKDIQDHLDRHLKIKRKEHI